jgi:hypothetical protein
VCSVLFSYDEGATTKIEYKRIEGGRKKAKRKREKTMTDSKFHYNNFS